MNPGEIYLHRHFYADSLPGEILDKYFVVLAKTPGGDLVIRLLTSRQNNRPEQPPCFHGDPYPGYYLGIPGGTLNRPTWVDLRPMDDADRLDARRNLERGRIELVVIATGDAKSDRAEALKMFGRGSTERNVVGLCSDSLSEGVNLQQAAALIHLDMPSVVRIAEQRVGRIDRLDSPHAVITAYWPDDAEEFALSSDERFIERHEAVETLLGANLVLPEEMVRESRPLSAREVIESIREEAEKGSWDGIQDAFEPVRAMIYGSSPLIEEPIYEHYKKVSARLRCGVGIVNSQTPWAFFCLSGGEFGAPRWVFMASPDALPQVDLEGVCGSLRERLTLETRNLALDDVATKLLDRFVVRLAQAERELLPRRKRRAIEELEHFLDAAMQAGPDDHERIGKIRLLNAALRQPEPELQPDLDEIAASWLDIIRPVWFERLKQRRKRPLLLKDIRPFVLDKMNALLPVVLERFSRIPILRSPDERVAACILGIPDDSAA